GSALKERAGDVHHVRRACALVIEGCAAALAEGANRAGFLVLVAGDPAHALDDAKPLAPAANICRIGGAVCDAARRGMIVPRPARGIIDLEANIAAKTARGHALAVLVRSRLHCSPPTTANSTRSPCESRDPGQATEPSNPGFPLSREMR